MYKICPVPSGGLGMVATHEYAIGDVIVEESEPLLCLAPSSDQDVMKLLIALPPIQRSAPGKHDNDQLSFLQSLSPPPSVPTEYVGKFKGMIQAVLCFTELIDTSPFVLSKAMELYSPNPDEPTAEERTIVKVAKEALRYIQKHSKVESKLRQFSIDTPDQALKLMLLWSCNAFEGGRIYEQQSRINHSCNPNAIIQPDGDTQVVRAVTAIASGEEITASYLGLLLYSDRPTRQALLIRNKHFACSCSQCRSYTSLNPMDVAAAIPCSTCHPRINGKYLEEDVAYDDDKVVNYMYPRATQDFECSACQTKIPIVENESNKEGTLSLAAIVSRKVLDFLDHRETRLHDLGKDKDDQTEEEWEDQMHQLTCSVVGSLHWTTNLVLLLRLNRILKRQHVSMLQTGETPEPEEIAEAIDMLERVCRFMEGLNLKLHIGHVLSSVIVGVARTLVSLGDSKSKRYASKWVSKIKDYSDTFDSEGMQKVVTSLWQAGDCNDDNDPVAKKARTE